jgi:hypothetical protein
MSSVRVLPGNVVVQLVGEFQQLGANRLAASLAWMAAISDSSM